MPLPTIAEETTEIKRLESMRIDHMDATERAIHYTKLKDCYWRRRRAQMRERGVPEDQIPGQFSSSE